MKKKKKKKSHAIAISASRDLARVKKTAFAMTARSPPSHHYRHQV